MEALRFLLPGRKSHSSAVETYPNYTSIILIIISVPEYSQKFPEHFFLKSHAQKMHCLYGIQLVNSFNQSLGSKMGFKRQKVTGRLHCVIQYNSNNPHIFFCIMTFLRLGHTISS